MFRFWMPANLDFNYLYIDTYSLANNYELAFPLHSMILQTIYSIFKNLLQLGVLICFYEVLILIINHLIKLQKFSSVSSAKVYSFCNKTDKQKAILILSVRDSSINFTLQRPPMFSTFLRQLDKNLITMVSVYLSKEKLSFWL